MRSTTIAIAAGVVLSGAGLTAASAQPASSEFADRPSAALSVSATASGSLTAAANKASTRTHLRLPMKRVHSGGRFVAVVRVTSPRSADPRGRVSVKMKHASGNAPAVRRMARLDDGVARVVISKSMRLGRYTVRAQYMPKSGSNWSASRSGSATAAIFSPSQCSDYPASVVSSTGLSLAKNRVRRGEANSARVTVRSVDRADSTGNVTLTISGQGPTFRRSGHLRNGVAQMNLPRGFKVGTYTVSASYSPSDCSQWSGSQSGSQRLTVVKR